MEAVVETGNEPVPAVSLIVAKGDLDYEIIITSAELRAMLYACDPEWQEEGGDENSEPDAP